MTIFALLLALANPALERYDRANDALTSCGFATRRDAAQDNRNLDQFRGMLANRCAGEIAQMRRAIIALESGRGKNRSAAQSSANQTIARFHAMHAEGYAHRQEDQAKLKLLIDAMEKEGETDAR